MAVKCERTWGLAFDIYVCQVLLFSLCLDQLQYTISLLKNFMGLNKIQEVLQSFQSHQVNWSTLAARGPLQVIPQHFCQVSLGWQRAVRDQCLSWKRNTISGGSTLEPGPYDPDAYTLTIRSPHLLLSCENNLTEHEGDRWLGKR